MSNVGWHVHGRSYRFAALILVLVLSATRSVPSASAAHPTANPDFGKAGPAPILDNLGNHHKRVTTRVPLAQRYFDQGLRLVYGFNHDEAKRAFQSAAAADPNCAMAPWGIALSLGPNYNLEVDAERQQAAHVAIQQARALSQGATIHERAYIEALAERFSADSAADRRLLDQAYVNAMRKVAASYPNDLDAATLFASAAMELRPWDLWLPDGKPQPGTEEIVVTLERVLERDPRHPGANHYYIHAVEASDFADRALPAADRLGGLMPGAGHMVHMPSHIYFRVGRYRDAAVSNEKAVLADRAYIEKHKPVGVYPSMYYPHNVHFLWAALCVEGRSAEALAAAEQFASLMPTEAIRAMPMLEGVAPTKIFTLALFNRWDAILAEPAPPEEFPYATGVWHYARGLAFCGLNRIGEAQAEEVALQKIIAATPADRKMMRHSPRVMLSIAQQTLRGRLAALQGHSDQAVEALRDAIRLQDTLAYDEPPAWYYPVRQTLGEVLLRSQRAVEAESVYREDLEDYPVNGWSLYGLQQSLRAQGRDREAEAVAAQFKQAWSGADYPLDRAQD